MPRQSPQPPINWLRVARLARRLTQRELSELSGLSRISIIHLENNHTRPRFETERKLAQALGYPVEAVFPPPGDPSPSYELRQWAKALNGGSR